VTPPSCEPSVEHPSPRTPLPVRSPLLPLLALLAPALALAQAEEIENPGTINAVQERKYRLQHELNVGVGVMPLDAFYKGVLGTVGYTYHFSDTFGWQVGRGAYSYNVSTGLRDQLERDFGVVPTALDEVQWMVGSDAVWSPFYGKFSWLNRRVLHFAGYLVAGGTVVKLNRGQVPFRPALNLGVGARLFSTEHVSFRLDVTNNVVFKGGTGILNVPTIQLSLALNFGATE